MEHIKADVAYSHLELLQGPDAQPGAGVTLGFIDSGIDDVSHGTAVAGIAAGARLTHSRAPHGLAWGADVVMFALTLGSSDGTYRPIAVEGLAAAAAS